MTESEIESDCNSGCDSDCDSEYDFMDSRTGKVWRSVSTWASLVDANVMFLKGEIGYSPTHMAAVCEETKPMVSKLIALNKYGFFTCTSQPPLDAGSVKQKGYVEGFITPNIVNELLEFLKARKDCYFQLDNGQMQHNFPCLVCKSDFSNGGNRYNVTVDGDREYTNFWIEADYRSSRLLEYQGNIWRLLEKSGVAFELAMKEYGGNVGADDVMLEFFRSTKLESHKLDL